MSFKTLFILVPVLCLASVGCKATCTGLCDEGKDQDCSSSSDSNAFDHAQCYAFCQREKDMEDDGVDNCKTEFDALMDCAGQQSNICKVWQPDTNADPYDDGTLRTEKCSSTSHDYATCVATYCSHHTSRDYCN